MAEIVDRIAAFGFAVNAACEKCLVLVICDLDKVAVGDIHVDFLRICVVCKILDKEVAAVCEVDLEILYVFLLEQIIAHVLCCLRLGLLVISHVALFVRLAG